MLKAENIDKTKNPLTKIGEGAFGEVFKYSKNGSNHILKVSIGMISVRHSKRKVHIIIIFLRLFLLMAISE